MPVTFAALSAARPFEAWGKLPGSLPARSPALALPFPSQASRSTGSSARLMATRLGQGEVLAVADVLGKLAARDFIHIDDADGDVGPTEQRNGG